MQALTHTPVFAQSRCGIIRQHVNSSVPNSNSVGHDSCPHAQLYQPKTEVNPLYIDINQNFKRKKFLKMGKKQG